MKPQMIAIIGAGLAGLSAATFLARQGHFVHIFDIHDELTASGSGLIIQPIGVKILDFLGMNEYLTPYTSKITGIIGTTKQNKVLLNHLYQETGEREYRYALGVHQHSMNYAFEQFMATVPNIEFHFNTYIDRYEETPNGVLLAGSSLYNLESSWQNIRYDALIIANGSKTNLRPSHWVLKDRVASWGYLWSITPWTGHLNRHLMHQRSSRSQYLAGVLPIGQLPYEQTPLGMFYWSLPTKNLLEWSHTQTDIFELKQHIISFWSQIELFISDITEPQQLNPFCYRQIHLNKIASGRVACIGDAGHSLNPLLGQGSTMALLDAVLLSYSFARHDEINLVMHQFNGLRHQQLQFYQKLNQLISPMYQSESGILSLLRDPLFNWLNHHSNMRGQIIKTIAGIKTGWKTEYPFSKIRPI